MLAYFNMWLSSYYYYLNYIKISFVYLVNSTPSLKDLYQHFTPQYATQWRIIGILLGIEFQVNGLISLNMTTCLELSPAVVT